MTVAVDENDHVWIGHVGDSRAYLLRDGELEQLTDDHSLVAELVRSGRLTPEEAGQHPNRSMITRVLGTEPDVAVDVLAVQTRPGDVFVLCSDGLWSGLGEEQIASLSGEPRRDLREVLGELGERAVTSSAPYADNTSAAAIRWLGP